MKPIEIVIENENDFDIKIDEFWSSINQYEKKFTDSLKKYEDEFNSKVKKFNDKQKKKKEEFKKIKKEERKKIKKEDKEKWKKFKKEFKEQTREFKEIFHFTPEKVKNKSPITFFNGGWGTGKTAFFEKLINKVMFDDEILKNSKFKNIAVIDLWKYTSSENMIDSILDDCLKIIYSGSKNQMWKLLNNKLNNFDIEISMPFKILNILIRLSFEKTEDNYVNQRDEPFKKIKPTILILENLERLEDKSIEIIKLFQKISELPDLLTIIPVCKQKLPYYNSNVDSEHWLEKYSTLGVEYNFRQSYIDYFKNIGVKKEYLKDFDESIKNTEISTRSLNNLFTLDKHIENFNEQLKNSKYHGLYYIEKHVFKKSGFNNQLIKSWKDYVFNDIDFVKNEIETLRVQFFNVPTLIQLMKEWEKFRGANFYEKIRKNKKIYSLIWFFNPYIKFKDWSRLWGYDYYTSSILLNKSDEMSKSEYKLLSTIIDYKNLDINFNNTVKEILQEIIVEEKINFQINNSTDNFYINEIFYLNKNVNNINTKKLIELIIGIINVFKNNFSQIKNNIEKIFLEKIEINELNIFLKNNEEKNKLTTEIEEKIINDIEKA